MKGFKPLVSVVIPTIPSRSALLTRALKSVKEQTYGAEHIEVVVVNEGLPATVQRNIGISRAHGDFIAFLDDDDTWDPTKIEKQVDYLLKHPSVCLVICYSLDLRRNPSRVSRPPSVITHSDLVKGFNLSSTSSYLVRDISLRYLKQMTGTWFDESLPCGHEYDLALRLSLEYMSQFHDIHCIPEVLMTQYKTPGQISENWGKKVRGQYHFMSKWGHEYGVLEYCKRIGLVGLFWLGYVFGDRVMIPINVMKEFHERGNI